MRPARSRRARTTPAAVLVVLLGAGCGAIGDGASSEPDGGVNDMPSDAAGAQNDGGGIHGDGDGTGYPATTTTPDALDPSRSSCLVNQPNAIIECSEAGCSALRSCCVGSGDCCSASTVGGLPETLNFGDCAGDDAVACLEGMGLSAAAFGDPAPFIADGDFYPGGDDRFDSGIAVGDSLDMTSHRLDLTVTFRTPEACSGSCREGVGVALTTGTGLDDTSHVISSAGLLLSGSRNEVAVLLADQPVLHLPITGAEIAVRMVARPTGEISIHADGTLRGTLDYVPSPEMRLVVFGRNRDRGTGTGTGTGGLLGARISQIQAAVSLCDIPERWAIRASVPIVTMDGAPYRGDEIEDPSVARDADGRELVAFANGGRILLGVMDDGTGELRLTHPVLSPAVSGGSDFDEAGVSDPEIVIADDGIRIYYTALGLDGIRRIGLAEEAEEGGFQTREFPVLSPDTYGLEHFEQPAVARHYSGQWIMVLRAIDADGRSQIMAFESDDGLIFAPLAFKPVLTGSAMVGESGRDLRVFPRPMADEVAAPSLAVNNGAWQLYYARRQGTRWSIGLMMSDDLLGFRLVDEPILQGDGTGFDRFGARGPDALIDGGTMRLFYTGLDGVRGGLGLAERQTPDFAAYRD